MPPWRRPLPRSRIPWRWRSRAGPPPETADGEAGLPGGYRGDDLDLEKELGFDEGGDDDSRAGGAGLDVGKARIAHFAEDLGLRDVGQIVGCFHHVLEPGADRLEHGFQVVVDLRHL